MRSSSSRAAPSPAFVISLDFELFWGLRDHLRLDDYRENLLGVRQAIPALLALFAARGIHATWATVGFLFCRDKRELEATIPRILPRYDDPALSPYDLTNVGMDEKSDPFHYAPSLIESIARTPGQEVATHTFSHFYCLEAGQTADAFDADLASAHVAAERLGVTLKSIVFPRNQDNLGYRGILRQRGLRTLRSVGSGWPYRASRSGEPRLKRALRLADAYLPVTGSRTFDAAPADALGLVDVPASAFLRPYARRLAPLDPLLLRRLTGAMDAAAENGRVFHLWWHPHNFGRNLAENLARLTFLLDHFATLEKRHGMQSLSMGELADRAA